MKHVQHLNFDDPVYQSDGSIKKLSDLGGEYTLPIASNDTLGGVKIGEGLEITEDGTLSASGGGSLPLFDFGKVYSATSGEWNSARTSYTVNVNLNKTFSNPDNMKIFLSFDNDGRDLPLRYICYNDDNVTRNSIQIKAFFESAISSGMGFYIDWLVLE